MDDEKSKNKKEELQEESKDIKIEVTEQVEDINSEEPEVLIDDEDISEEDTKSEVDEGGSDNEAEKDNFELEEKPEQETDKNKTLGEAMDEADAENSDIFAPDEDIDKAVDDIVRTESDEAIAEADAKLEALEETKKKKSFKDKVKSGFSAWWNNKPARYGTFAGLFLLFIATILLPVTRYGVLNLAGVRVSSSMVVIDSQTRLPLKNINVSLQDKTSTTDSEGFVKFDELKLGSSQLAITKRGYADNIKEIVLGWGSNPIGEQEIVATGEQFTFVLSDWQSGEKITKAEATAGENSALADDQGKIILTIGEDNIADVEVSIEAENYRNEIIKSDQLTKEQLDLKLVPSRKHVFVSNRTGEYDVYKVDLDQKNEEVLLGSTGKEREVPVVIPHPNRNLVALVSSRDGEENRDGFILDGLFIIDVQSGETKRIARSEQLQILGWSGDNLIFWQVVEGTSQANPERSKIISYNERTAERTDLAAANYFNDIELVDDKVYYAVSSFAVPQSQAKLYSVKVDGSELETLLDKQVWSIYRTSYEKLIFNSEDQKWYEKTEELLQEIGQQPAPQPIDYVDSQNGDKTAWVEIRDGKGVLLTANTSEMSEDQVLSLAGLSEVLYWVNDTSLVFRVISNSETADYLIDFTKNEQVKITDVTATRNTYF